jgi:HEAT repeat protein
MVPAPTRARHPASRPIAAHTTPFIPPAAEVSRPASCLPVRPGWGFVMTKRRTFWSMVLLFVLGALAVLLPSSPAYAPKLFARYLNQYDGHGAGYWKEALNDPDVVVRRKAAFALGVLGKDAEDAVPALAAIMVDDADEPLRIEASLALSKLGPVARPAVPSLARALGDAHPLVRLNAARTLLNLGGEARPALPALIEAMKAVENEQRVPRFDVSIREVATVAVGRTTCGTDEAVPLLVEALEGAHTSGMKRAAARGLGEVGANARPAVPRLRELLDDEDPLVQDAAEKALLKIGKEPAPAG